MRRSTPLIADPAVGIVTPPGMSNERMAELMVRQTETSWTLHPNDVADSPYLWCPGTDIEELEDCHLESLVLVEAAVDLDFAIGGWAAPDGTIGRAATTDQGSLTLIRRLQADASHGPVRGTLVPQITQVTPESPTVPPVNQSAGYLLNIDGGDGAVSPLPVYDSHARLIGLANNPGPPTVLFLAPYLAVGGAENLLFDLIDGLVPEHRALVVTLDPHRTELGQTVDRCRRLTPHVYTLGDWMPREARIDALRHLLRRWRVETLVSWNGTVDFYDHVLQLKGEFPDLRILAQLYNHEGGWIDKTTKRLLTELHGHLAINDRISDALISRGAPPDRVHTVHHGVRIPPPISDAGRLLRKRARRLELGIPEGVIVVGSFIRLHAQKRPTDIVRLARKLGSSGFHFLLVGGGPEDDTVDREIRRDPPPNLLRLPLQNETSHLYEAVDICLLTSEYEGLPVFLLDGLVREIPCVATAVGEIPELLRDGGGILVDTPGDLDSFADALIRLKEPNLRSKEGQRGRQTVVNRFSVHTYVSNYQRLMFPERSV